VKFRENYEGHVLLKQFESNFKQIVPRSH